MPSFSYQKQEKFFYGKRLYFMIEENKKKRIFTPSLLGNWTITHDCWKITLKNSIFIKMIDWLMIFLFSRSLNKILSLFLFQNWKMMVFDYFSSYRFIFQQNSWCTIIFDKRPYQKKFYDLTMIVPTFWFQVPRS